jgi:hypothetical protein
MSKKEETYRYVLAGLLAFNRLDRKATDEAGWIALKLGVSRAKAELAIMEARAWEAKAAK